MGKIYVPNTESEEAHLVAAIAGISFDNTSGGYSGRKRRNLIRKMMNKSSKMTTNRQKKQVKKPKK
jgi:hypothetical protein